MSIPSHAEILKVAFERLNGDAALKALVNDNVFNHIPQERALPCLRVRWAQAGEWDTKDSDGVDGYIFVDVWTDHRGDKDALTITDRVLALLHLAPLALTTGQSLILRHDFVDTFTESDGLTHHTAIRFHHIATN
jgi:hypothetical protein